MAVDYPVTLPDLLTRFGINPLDFTSYTDFLRELQALFNAIGTNPAGTGGTVDGRLDNIEAAIAAPAKTIITADSTAIANSTTELAFSNGKLTIAANSAVIGRTYRLMAGGAVSTKASAPGLIKLTVRWGNTNTDPLLVNLGAGSTQIAASLTNAGWFLDALVTIRTIGASGTAQADGRAVVSANYVLSDDQVTTATVNTTIARDLTLFARWTVADPSNTIQLKTFLIEQVN